MKQKKISVEMFEITDPDDLTSVEIDLIDQAREASKKAYAPYSNFKVGAALLVGKDLVITGNNQENAAYPSGLCAERVALFHASSNYPDQPIKALAITAIGRHGMLDEPVFPCGSCRQVMLEYENSLGHPIKIILAGRKKIIILKDAKQLLPLAFDKRFLNK
jgi:cytidine deaminase